MGRVRAGSTPATLASRRHVTGAPGVDARLDLGEDGPRYRAGTTEFVACFSQSSATECDDEDLVEQLEAALRALRVAERG